MKKLMFGILMAFGLVSVSWAVSGYILEDLENKTQFVKNKVEYLEDLEKNGLLPSVSGKSALKEGKLYLEFVEKVKQSDKECMSAIYEIMSDDNNKDRYQYYLWADPNLKGQTCMTIKFWIDKLKEVEKDIKRNCERYDAFIRQKANVMKSGDGALLKDGVTEVGTLCDGTKIEIVKEKK